MRICLVAIVLLQSTANAYYVRHPDGSITRVRPPRPDNLEQARPELEIEPRFLSQFKSQEQLKAVQDAHEAFVNSPYGTLGMGSGAYYQGMTKRDQYSTSANYMDTHSHKQTQTQRAPKLERANNQKPAVESSLTPNKTEPDPRFLSQFKSQEQLNAVQQAHEAFVNSPYGTLGMSSGTSVPATTTTNLYSSVPGAAAAASSMEDKPLKNNGFDFGNMDDHLESQRKQHSHEYGEAKHERQQDFINNPWGTKNNNMPREVINELQRAPIMKDDANYFGPTISQQNSDFIHDAYGSKQGPAYHGLQQPPPMPKRKTSMPPSQNNNGVVGSTYAGNNQSPPSRMEDPMYGPTKARELGDFVNDPYGNRQGPAYHGLYPPPKPQQRPVVPKAQQVESVNGPSNQQQSNQQGPSYKEFKASDQLKTNNQQGPKSDEFKAPQQKTPVMPEKRQAPKMKIPVMPDQRQAPKMKIPVMPEQRQAPNMKIPVMPEQRQAPNMKTPQFRQDGIAPGQFNNGKEYRMADNSKQAEEKHDIFFERKPTAAQVKPGPMSRAPDAPKIQRPYTPPKVAPQSTVNTKASVGAQQKQIITEGVTPSPVMPRRPQDVRAFNRMDTAATMRKDVNMENTRYGFNMDSTDGNDDDLMQAYFNEMKPSF